MKSLYESINEHLDQLSHELKLGDFIQFKPRQVPCTCYGQIQEITDGEKPKYKVRIMGWLGDKSMRDKITKDFYEINVDSKSIYQIEFKNQEGIDKLRKENILI